MPYFRVQLPNLIAGMVEETLWQSVFFPRNSAPLPVPLSFGSISAEAGLPDYAANLRLQHALLWILVLSPSYLHRNSRRLQQTPVPGFQEVWSRPPTRSEDRPPFQLYPCGYVTGFISSVTAPNFLTRFGLHSDCGSGPWFI